MDQIHPVEYLFERLEEFDSHYPPGVVPVLGRIPSLAFFPGGYGLWGTGLNQPLPPMPVGGVMVLGHNFDSEAGFAYSLKHEGENLKGATWRNLLLLLEGAHIPKEQCFFTNFYMGLIAGTKAVGRFPGAKDPNFVQRCRNFLREQLKVMQPKVVLILGRELSKVGAPLSEGLSQWVKIKSWQDIDQKNMALIYPVVFEEVPYPTAVVAVVHPSYRPVNIGRRRYQDLRGEQAELATLCEAVARAGSIS